MIGGTFFALNESVEIGMYIASKAGEALLDYWVLKGKIKPLPNGSVVVYTFGAAALLFISLIEPESIRPSYLRYVGLF